jgi:hypothetical protein
MSGMVLAEIDGWREGQIREAELCGIKRQSSLHTVHSLLLKVHTTQVHKRRHLNIKRHIFRLFNNCISLLSNCVLALLIISEVSKLHFYVVLTIQVINKVDPIILQ